jgi:hypothetical protein
MDKNDLPLEVQLYRQQVLMDAERANAEQRYEIIQELVDLYLKQQETFKNILSGNFDPSAD